MKKIRIGNILTVEDVVEVAKGASVGLALGVEKKVNISRKVVDKAVKMGKVKYGITTGFGALASRIIDKKNVDILQKNLILSHSSGVGNPFPEDVVRVAMVLKANELAKGRSGVRIDVLNTLVNMINKGVHPVVPEKGSLGASGDLAPLAHIALVIIGMGQAFYKGKKMDGKAAMKRAGIPCIELSSKEGVALINGTAVMTAIGALSVKRAENLLKVADIAGAMSMETLKSAGEFLDNKIHRIRPHNGQITCAKNLRLLTEGSELVASDHSKVQDAYSIRCMPQVHGASRDALSYARKVIETEINSVTDNPLIFGNKIVSGGNFHGQPVAFAMDFLGIGLSVIGSISERRIARLVDRKLSGLPAFLVENAGINSGFMLPHYTAAALVSENKILASPASVDSIPVSAGQEDHVSMGTIAARKGMQILENVERIIAVELMCGAQGIDFHHPLKPGIGTTTAHESLRKIISKVEKDRIMYEDIETATRLVQSGDLVHIVEKKIGKLF